VKNVVFIPNVDLGNGRSTPYHYSVKSWKNWCDKNDVICLEWTEPIMDSDTFPIIMQREWVFDIIEHNEIDYDQIAIVDADTIVHPDCPNFFEETNHNYSAVVNKKHKPFFDEIKDLYLNRGEEIKHYRDTIKASTGQTMVNFMLKKNNIEVTKLPEGYNLQDLFRKNLLHIPNHSWFSDELHFLNAGWVYHFNAIPQNDRHVSYWMERTYNELYK